MKKLLLLTVALCLSVGMAQTFVFQTVEASQTLDPLAVWEFTTRTVVDNIYEGLFGYRGPGVEPEPLLATSYELSNDDLTYTFHLRDGVAFHSGNPFSCKDVEYSIKRALVVAAWQLLAEPLLGGSYSGDVLAGATTDAEYAGYWAKIERSAECPDDKTFVIRTLEPDPSFLAKLVNPNYSIVDSEWAKAGGMWDGTEATWRDWLGVDLGDKYLYDKASGTGAYQLVTWEPDVRLVAKANPNYWGGAPQIETVINQVVEDEDARIQALLAGDADQIDLDDTSRALLDGKPGVRVLDRAKDSSLWGSIIVYTIQLNEAIIAEDNDLIGSGKLDGRGIPPDFFSDRDVRECFAYAFDPEAYKKEAFDGQGEPLTMALLPGYPGYDASIPEYSFDLAKAEEHCRAAWGGRLWENGMHLILPYANVSPRSGAVARILKTNLESLSSNFTFDLREVEWGPDWFPYFDEPLLPVDMVGTFAPYPDSAAFIDPFYKSPDSFASFYGYKNEEMDRLIEEASSEMNEAKRAELYSQVGRIGYEDVPFIVLPYGPDTVAISNKILDVYGNPVLSTYRWKDISKAQ